MRTKFLQSVCLLVLMLAIPGLALGQNLTVKITAGTTTTVTGKSSLEDALTGIVLPEITALEISAGTFTAADWLYLKSNNKAEIGLIALANFSITDGVDAVADMPTTDGEHPYFSSNLKSFSAHKLQTVGAYAFYNCNKLSNANMPDVTMLGERALANTGGLKQINLPQLETVGMYAFVNCGVESLTLPKAKNIANYAFMSAGNLTTIKLPSVTTITAQKLFYGSAVTYLGLSSRPTLSNPKNNTFEGAPSPRYLLLIDANGNELTGSDSVNLANSFSGGEWQGYKLDHSRLPINLNIVYNKGRNTKAGTGNTLKDAITKSGVALGSIEKITIASGEILATDWVWLRNNKSSLKALTHFTVEESITAVSNIPSGSASVLSSPLAEFSVAKLNILGTRALYSITSLQKVNLPQATVIEQQVFAQCTRLHDVSIPQVNSIQGRAFYFCGSLTTLHLPKVTLLNQPSIFDGSALTYLKLGASPIRITGDALDGCPSPRFVVLVDDNGDPLTGIAKTNAENKYQTHTGYKNNLWYGFRINGSQQPLTVVLNNDRVLPRSGSSLKDILSAIPDPNKSAISSIEVVAGEFIATDWVYLREVRGLLSNLRQFTIADLPEVIAVSDMPAVNTSNLYFSQSLQEVSLAKVERIGFNAFTDNVNLRKAFFPHVKRLDTYAFLRCSMLDTISLPRVAVFNGSGIFNGSSITYMKIGATPPVADNVSNGAFSGSSEVRFLLFCDNNGNMLSGPDLTTAEENYRNHFGYDRSTKLWYGWNIDNKTDSLEVIINGNAVIKEIHLIACLDSAAKLGISRSQIETIEVTKGNVTGSDWSNLRANRGTLSNLKKFFVHNTVTSVAPLGKLDAVDTGEQLYFPISTEEVHIAKMTTIGQNAFRSAKNLKYINLPNLYKVETSILRISTLQKVSLPNVQSVRSYFLERCSNVKVLQLSSTPITIENGIDPTFSLNTPSVKYIQIVGSNGAPLTGQALENAKENYRNDVVNYNKNEKGDASASSKWRGWTLGTTVKVNIADVENGSISVPIDLVLRDTLANKQIIITVTPDAGYRLKEGSLRVYNTEDENVEVALNGKTFTLPMHDVTIAAEFEPITWTISATADPIEGGSISGAGTYNQGASTTLMATPSEGYSFVGWKENGVPYSTEASISIADIAANRTFVAEFAQKTYTLTYIAGANGTLEGGSPQTQTVVHGQNANPVEAKANSGYHFKKWSDNSTQNPRSLENVTKDSTITAEFEKDINIFSIIAEANPTEGGSVNGAGTYNENTTATLKATANEGYKFVGWEENGNVESTDAEYSFTVKSNRTLVARFEKITYTLTYTAGDGGKIKHNGAEQKEVILSVVHGADGEEVEAVASDGYRFVQWSDGITTPVRTEKGVVKNEDFTAEFELEQYNTFSIAVQAYPAEGGTVDGDGMLREYSTAELTVQPNKGYYFVEWVENGASVTSDNPYSFEVVCDRNLTAVFDSVIYTLSYSAGEGGEVTGQLTQNVKYTKDGTEVVAKPANGYRFVRWSDNNSTSPSRIDYNVSDDIVATAIFELIPPTHTIAVTVNPLDAGSVNGAGDYEEGQTATLSATASIGFEFESWFDGVNTITDNPYTFAVTEPRNIVAQFKATNVYTVTATANPAEGGVIVGDGQYNENATATLTATANEGYRFVEWTVNGSQVSSASIYTFTVTENIELTAEFELIPTFTVTAIADPVEGGTISGNGSYYENEEAVLIATPAAHYKFVRWTLEGNEVSTSEQYTIDHVGRDYINDELVAVFEYDANITVYNIMATAEPAEGGSISGDGQYNENATATLTATANEGYRFVEWTVNGSQVSNTSIYEFTVTEDLEITAVFALIPTFTVSAIANPAEGGSISGEGTYNEGATATLTATPNTGYNFVKWTEDGADVSTEATLTFTVASNRSLVAEFMADASTPCTPYNGEFTITTSNSYEWNGQTYTESGDYQQTYTTAAGCDSTVTLHLTISTSSETGINDAITESLNIYPNPTANAVYVDMPSNGVGEVLVYNANGQMIQRVQGQGQILIDLTAFPSGMYFIRIGNAVGKVIKL